jgi:hypothetical protein
MFCGGLSHIRFRSEWWWFETVTKYILFHVNGATFAFNDVCALPSRLAKHLKYAKSIKKLFSPPDQYRSLRILVEFLHNFKMQGSTDRGALVVAEIQEIVISKF